MTPTQTKTRRKIVWHGSKALRRHLVPVDSLEPFPGNARRGDVPAVKASLVRFGQVRAVLVDGDRIIAGHHVVLACAELGWTHVAVLPNEFRDEDEQRAYNAADNRIPELGGYDDELLVAQLRALAEVDALDGTGFRPSDVDDALARLAATNGSALTSRGQREHRDPTKKELVLIYSAEQLDQIEVFLGIVGKAEGTDGPSEIVFNALRDKAHHLNA